MVNLNMCGIPPIDLHPEELRVVADVIVADCTAVAFTAALPGVDDASGSDFNTLGVWSNFVHDTCHFMSWRYWECSATLF
jgi:hypothetical protein